MIFERSDRLDRQITSHLLKEVASWFQRHLNKQPGLRFASSHLIQLGHNPVFIF